MKGTEDGLRVVIRRAMDGRYSVDAMQYDSLLFAKELNLRPGETLTLHIRQPRDQQHHAQHGSALDRAGWARFFLNTTCGGIGHNATLPIHRDPVNVDRREKIAAKA